MNFKGKLLLRTAINSQTNKPMLIVCGWLIPEKTIEVDKKDEMWAVDLEIKDARKFINVNKLNFSPEDFLENVDNIQNPDLWEKK